MEQKNSIPLKVLSLYLLVFLTPVLAGDNFPVLGGDMVGMFIWTIMVLIYWSAVTLVKPAGFRELVRFKYLLPLFLFLFWLIISIPFSSVIHASIHNGLYWAVAILLAITVAQLRLKRKYILDSLFSLTVSGALVALYGIYQAVWGFSALSQTPGLTPEDLRLIQEVQRPFSFFPGANVFGGFLVVFIPISALLICKLNSAKTRIVAVVSLVLIITGLLFSYSRGAWLVAIVSLVLTAVILLIGKNKKELILLFIAIAVAVPLFYLLQLNVDNSRTAIKQSVTEKISTVANQQNSSIHGRISYWQTAINMGNDKPVFGHGSGTFEHISRQYQQTVNYVKNPHNFVLKIYAELGLMGALFFVAFIIGIIYFALKRYTKEKDIQPLLLLLAFIGVLLHGLIDLDFNSPAILFIFIMLGIFILGEKIPQSEKRHKLDFVLKGLTITFVVPAVFVFSFFPLIAHKFGEEANAASNSSALGKAVELSEESVGYWPLDPGEQYKLSRLYIRKYEMTGKTEDLQNAVNAVQNAITLNPYHPEYYHGLADLFSITGRNQDILEAIHKAAELYPQSIYYGSEYARALSSSGNPDKAIEVLDKSLEKENDYLANNNPNGIEIVRARFLKASILATNKRYQEAKEECARIFELLEKPGLVLDSFTSSRKSGIDFETLKKETRNFVNELDKAMNKKNKPEGDKPENQSEEKEDE